MCSQSSGDKCNKVQLRREKRRCMVVFDGNARSDSSFNRRKIVEGSSVVLRPVFRKLGGAKLHLGDTGMRGIRSSSRRQFLEIHGAISTTFCLELGKVTDHQVRANCEIRLQQLDLDAFGFDEPHHITSWIPVEVRIMQLLPAVKLVGIHEHQQLCAGQQNRATSSLLKLPCCA
jgi:hypothetical protein